MLQDVLAEPEWEEALTTEDRRGLTPLFWTHVAPYGPCAHQRRVREFTVAQGSRMASDVAASTHHPAIRPPPPAALTSTKLARSVPDARDTGDTLTARGIRLSRGAQFRLRWR
jgi:hypothetical protein